jgi:uncharacterized protein
MSSSLSILDQIHQALSDLRTQHGIRVLHACESGSRAWGFASPDSDYDVRIVYCYDQRGYLRVFDVCDQIELPITGELDVAGWDLRKTLRLLARSNAVVFEWLQSPILYGGEPRARDALWQVALEVFDPKACINHYLGIVRSSLSTVDSGGISIKKVFYVLRPLLAAYWIAERRSVPPMEFEPLRDMLENHPSIQSIVDDLLKEKAMSAEKHRIPLCPALQRFVDDTRLRCQSIAEKLPKGTADITRLDTVFRELVEAGD